MAWGANNFAQLGDGARVSAVIALPDRPTPRPVVGLTNVVAIAGGGNHSLALRSDNTVWAWGLNGHGQLGNGTLGGLAGTSTPVRVVDLGDPEFITDEVVAIAAGFSHSLAITLKVVEEILGEMKKSDN
jgi:alpha-tubulin suppressor-like RCC1 family protein